MTEYQGMAEHHATVTIGAPIHQVYALFSHFNDFPKFMGFVKEVTYYDKQRSHWVAEVVGRHEWDAINEAWAENRQIGWRSTAGLENAGRVTFQTVGPNLTRVDVYVYYNPPTNVLGDVGEHLGVEDRFQAVLQQDLDNLSQMVDQAPPGALDPQSSGYLFHADSAAAKGSTTKQQNETMVSDSRMNPGMTADSQTYAGMDTPTERPVLDRDIIAEPNYVRSTHSTQETRQPTMPSESGVRNPVMPPESGVRNPVMPPEGGTQNPVMPPVNRTYNSSPVMPPEDGPRNPVMPPESDKGY